jgi:hypothetical protein
VDRYAGIYRIPIQAYLMPGRPRSIPIALKIVTMQRFVLSRRLLWHLCRRYSRQKASRETSGKCSPQSHGFLARGPEQVPRRRVAYSAGAVEIGSRAEPHNSTRLPGSPAEDRAAGETTNSIAEKLTKCCARRLRASGV